MSKTTSKFPASWSLVAAEVRRIRELLCVDLFEWEADANQDFVLTIEGDKGTLEGFDLVESSPKPTGQNLMRDLVAAKSDQAVNEAALQRINAMLNGEDAPPVYSVDALTPAIEYLVKRCWELQDAEVERERRGSPT